MVIFSKTRGYNVLDGARVIVGAFGEEDEDLRRV